jgi:predicted metalloprotease with PDZ domain
VLSRQRSNGKLSLDDFCRRFHGGSDTPPLVKTYTFDDVVNTLNEVMPYDWRRFLTGVYKLNYHGGERYPHLERDSTKPDVLGEVIKSRR